MPYLAHHGIKGQKWGIRRYQSEDGSLTKEGKSRLDSDSSKKKVLKRSVIIGGSVVAVGLAAYGAYKYSDLVKTQAGQKICQEGNDAANKLLKQAAEYTVRSFSGGSTSVRMHNQILWGTKARNAENEAANILRSTVDRANDVSSSFAKSYRYLHPKK